MGTADRDNPDHLAREIRMHLVKAFLNDFRGFRLREILSESVGEDELRFDSLAALRRQCAPVGNDSEWGRSVARGNRH